MVRIHYAPQQGSIFNCSIRTLGRVKLYMPYKDKEKQRAAQREYARRNKEANKKRLKNQKERNREWFNAYREGLECIKCGESHIACLEFHHKKEDEKTYSVGQMVHAGYSLDKIKKEIEKCEVLCSNCHRKHHWEEKSGNCKRQRHTRKKNKRSKYI